jgi:hypothetical protein
VNSIEIIHHYIDLPSVEISIGLYTSLDVYHCDALTWDNSVLDLYKCRMLHILMILYKQ